MLHISDSAGAADLEMQPGSPNVLFACMWHGQRKPWTIISGAREGGIYKSTDGGDHWTKLAGGLPHDLFGRSNVAISAAAPNRIYALSEQAFNAMYRAYDSTLKFVLRHRPTTVAASLLLLAATVVLFVKIPKGFFPSEDIGQIFAITEGAQGISFNSMYEHQAAVNRVISADTNVLNFTSSIGAGGSTVAANGGRIFIRLKPRSERRLHVDQIIQKLRAKLAAIPGIKVYLQNPPAIRIGGMLTRSLYQYTLQSTDTRELYHWASIIEAKMARLPGFQDVSSDLLIRTPQVNVEIDRDKAPALGVTAEQIESALYDAYGSRQISTISRPWACRSSPAAASNPPMRRHQAGLSSSTKRWRTGSGKGVTRLGNVCGPTSVPRLALAMTPGIR